TRRLRVDVHDQGPPVVGSGNGVDRAVHTTRVGCAGPQERRDPAPSVGGEVQPRVHGSSTPSTGTRDGSPSRVPHAPLEPRGAGRARCDTPTARTRVGSGRAVRRGGQEVRSRAPRACAPTTSPAAASTMSLNTYCASRLGPPAHMRSGNRTSGD